MSPPPLDLPYRKPSFGAHLFILCVLDAQGVPRFKDVRILSDEMPTHATNTVWAKVISMTGYDSFQEALDAMRTYLKNSRSWAWPWIEREEEERRLRDLSRGRL